MARAGFNKDTPSQALAFYFFYR